MINKHLEELIHAEKIAEISHLGYLQEIRYKRFNQTWIRSDRPLNEIYKQTLKYSELQFFPNLNYKAWGIWILMKLKLKKGTHKLKDLLGIGLRWYFKKAICLPLQADVIYGRHPAVIMVYTSPEQMKVIKTAVIKWGKNLMKSEVHSQRLASSLKSKEVFIPNILKEVYKEHLNTSVEDYFRGTKQSFKDKVRLQESYKKVFEFLLDFYLSNLIELKNLSENRFLNKNYIEEFILKKEGGERVNTVFKRIYAKEKKMILCRIHGDLSHNNILSYEDKVCIIDWGKSKHHYLFTDMDNSSINTRPIYKQFIKLSKIDSVGLYSYDEQLFLIVFIEMCRLIHDVNESHIYSSEFHRLIDSKIEKLIKISEKLS